MRFNPANRWKPGPDLASGLTLLVCGVSLALWTRRSWCDPLIDFGQQLYVPWRLASGQVLYRDLAWFNGPLSAYFNSLLFRLTGPSLLALSLLNLAVAAAACLLLYTLLRAAAGRAAAFLGCLFFLGVHAFGQTVFVANYNFINPYSHEATHGLLLGLAALFSLRRWRLTERRGWLAAAGLLVGLSLLTKAEVSVAAAGGAGADLWLTLRRRPRGAAAPSLAIFTAACLAPLAVCFAAFSLVLGPGGAALATIGSWRAVFHSSLSRLPFFRNLAGTEAPARNALVMLKVGLWYLLGVAVTALAASRPRGSRRGHGALEIAVAALLLTALLAAWTRIPLRLAARPLPLAMVISAILWLRVASRRSATGRSGAVEEPDTVLCFSFSIFALATLPKIFLKVGLGHYGFALAMPAAVLTVAALTGWLPAWLEGRGWRGSLFRWVASAGVLAVILGHISVTGPWLRGKTVLVGRGGDQFLADWRGEFVNWALEEIEGLVGPGQTLLVLPEGVMLNYLARRVNPTPYTNLMPTEMTIYGENAVLAGLKSHAPDWILLVDKDTSEFGFRYFGQDYGRSIMRWIDADYRAISGTGDPPFSGGDFGMLLLTRLEPAAASP